MLIGRSRDHVEKRRICSENAGVRIIILEAFKHRVSASVGKIVTDPKIKLLDSVLTEDS